MDSERWDRIQALFHEAAPLAESERLTFLSKVCGEDQELLNDILALLEEDAQDHSFLDQEISQIAQQVLNEPSGSSLPPRIGPYRLQRLLGEGGMGVVYLAVREDLGSLAAIKILRDAWLSPARRERFASEQRTLAQLNHPSIARLYDADTLADGSPWFVMEFVEGEPLTIYCRKRNHTVEQRLTTFRSVCEAVQYAHGHAIIHRDLKPSNILVTADGSVKLLDFGLAKQLDLPMDQTRTGLRFMTPAYAAPEQIRGDSIGIHTDVYALGVILYELLAGSLPFDFSRCTPGETERLILEQEPEKPSIAAKRWAPPLSVFPKDRTSCTDLDVLCLTAMHKDPLRRYRSVEALIRDIDHYVQGEPLEARPDSSTYRLGKFVTRNRRAILAAVAGLAVVVALVVFFTARLAIARDAALAETARTQRIQTFLLNLFEGGEKDAGPATSAKVVDLLDRGATEARSLGADPELQAELHETLGGIYQKLGDLKQADLLLQSSLDERRKLVGPNHPLVVKSLTALGLLRVDQAQLADAEQLVRTALATAKQHLAPNHPLLPKVTAALGRILEERGQYEEAIRTLDEAVRLYGSPDPPTPDLAASLVDLAGTHFYAGHYAISESLNQRLLVMHGKLYGPRHPLIAEDLINLGAIRLNLGRYKEAEEFDRRALQITEAWYGKESPKTAANLTMLGRALSYQSRYDDAQNILQQALSIQERTYGPAHPRVASILNDLGALALKSGRLSDAETDFRRIGAIYRTTYGDHHYLTGIAISNLATVYMERQQYSNAEQLYRNAVQRFTEALSANDLNTGIARIKLGRSLLRQRKYSEAETETLAGYKIVKEQANPSVSFLQAARQDLAQEYDALRKPEQAAYFRAELTKN